ncbi:hypothetical protein OCH239_10815 [Roseivivax halodurans JCM 10272]|uniref:Uncharacterized protein n=1 Tax=Roseivivax halodurans JCM 10272 TaxID=1449350 RepID=X7EDR4_9RHOB|nr:hypothetical protein [Roseivivax halodurans]ETX13326.1 hypothetical protein OCH239_10815 [Roseivivax halodurans JCM 10272]
MTKKLVTTADFLRAYQDGLIGREDCMDGIGVHDYRAFSAALLGSGFHLPRGTDEEVAEEVAGALPLLRGRLVELGELR